MKGNFIGGMENGPKSGCGLEADKGRAGAFFVSQHGLGIEIIPVGEAENEEEYAHSRGKNNETPGIPEEGRFQPGNQ